MATSSDRRSQIVEATLDLLALGPLAEVTTRRIARRVGITQPGLFRHFRSRDEIVLAAIDHLRDQLAQVAARAIEPGRDPLEAITLLVQGVVGTAVEWPGLPRLLFQDVGGGPGSPFRGPLAHLASMQVALMAELTRRAVAAGQLPPVDPERAAGLLLGLIQGTLLGWQQSGTPADRVERTDTMLSLWVLGLRGGALPEVELPEAEVAAVSKALQGLDTRPLLAKGVDPLGAILSVLERLPADGLLELAVPFKPTPLLALLGSRGFRVEARPVGPGLFGVEILGPDAPELLDLRELAAPEPMVAVLEAASELEAGGSLLARTPQAASLVGAHLAERGLEHVIYKALDGSGLLHVRRPASES